MSAQGANQYENWDQRDGRLLPPGGGGGGCTSSRSKAHQVLQLSNPIMGLVLDRRGNLTERNQPNLNVGQS